MREIHIRRMSYQDAKQKLETELNEAFMQGESRVDIVHGIGQGKLKAMAMQIVRESNFCSLIPEERILYRNPGVLPVDLFPPDRATMRMYRA